MKRARNYDAVLVLGCDSARYTVEKALEDTDCKVLLAMRMTGLTNAAIEFRLPMTVHLEQKVRVQEGGEVETVP